jgi:hypothetical protein
MQKQIVRNVVLNGITDIMFDRYAGDNKTELPVEQKMYFNGDGKSLIIPAINIISFLSAQNTPSAPKRLLDSREYKKVAQALLSYTVIKPMEIPLTRNGKPIMFTGFDDDQDKAADMYIHRSVARLEKGIPNPKVRPVVRTPWEISFELTLLPNNEVQEALVKDMFDRGGLAIGLGTFRGVFGKFVVDKWK